MADKCLMLIDESGGAVAKGETGELVVEEPVLPKGTGVSRKKRPQSSSRIHRFQDSALQDGDPRAILGRWQFSCFFGETGPSGEDSRLPRGHARSGFCAIAAEEVREAATVARNESDELRLVAFVVFKQGC